jgi:hypothetical protein
MANTFNHNDKVVITDGGSVGIGTTSPNAKLEIYSATPEIIVNYLGNSVNGALWFNRDAQKKAGIVTTSEGAYARKGLAFYTNDAGDYTTNATEKMRIDDSGNVGIGTTSPSHKLDVNGGIKLNGASTLTDSAYFIGSPSYGFRWNSANDAFNNVIMYDNGNMYVRGNVGIGTTTPSTVLNIYRNNTLLLPQLRVENNGTGDAAMSFVATGVAGWAVGLDNSDGDKFKISTSTGDVGTNTAFTIDGSGNVGIGTTSPTQKLDVVGKMKISNDIILAQTSGRIDYDNGVSTGALRFFSTSGNTERMRITSAGNVGIGTTNPSEKFVVSNGGAAGFEWVPLTGRWYRYNRSTAAYAGIYTEASEHTWSIGASEAMRLNASGNVGIGTTSPAQKLHIVSTDGANIILNSNTGAENNGIWMTEGGVATPYANGAYVYYDSANNAFKINTGTSSLSTRFEIARDTGAIKFNSYDSTNNTGTPTYLLGTDASGNIVKTNTVPGSADGPYLPLAGGTMVGNVLMGNTVVNPASGFSDQTGIGLGYSTTVPTLEVSSDSAAMQLGRTSTGGEGQILALRKAGTVIHNFDTNNVSIGTNATFAGNVGIGTTAPQAPLHVIAASNNNNALIQEWSYTSTQLDIYSLMLKQTVTSGVVRYNFSMVNNGTPYNDVLVLDRGNVGIGTTSPTTKLHVNLNETGYIARIQGDTNNISFYDGGSGGIGIGSNTNQDLKLYTNDTLNNGIVIKSSGNVGIGTTSPAKKLDVRGGYFITSDGTGNEQAYVQGGSGYAFFGNYSTGKAAFGNSENWTTLVADGGNVGIGTTNPTQKLEVIGTLRLHDGVDNGRILFRGDRTDVYIQELSYGLLFGAPSGLFFEVDTNNNGQGIFNITRQGSSSFYINDSQNVGIGTTSPSFKLDVSGVVRATNAFISSEAGIISGLGPYDWVFMGQHGDDASRAASVMIGDISGAKYAIHGGSYGLNFAKHRADTDTFHTAFALLASSVDDSSVNVHIPNSLGIGTTSPGEMLDVRGNIRFGTGGTGSFGEGLLTMNSGWGTGKYPTIGSYDGSAGSLIMLHNPHVPFRTDNAASGSYTGRAGLRMAIDTAATNWWDAGLAGDFYHIFKSTGGEFLRITNTGNVGIGTTSPASKLQVNVGTDQNVAINSTGGVSRISAYDDAVANSVPLIINGSDLRFYNNTAEAVRITAGNVGIGTTSPTSKLHVNSAGGSGVVTQIKVSQDDDGAGHPGANAILQSSGWGEAFLVLGGHSISATSGTFNILSTSSLVVRTNSFERMRITSAGNVGIGTTSPTASLQVGSGTSNTSNRSGVAIFSARNDNAVLDALSLVNTSTGNNNNGTALNFHNGSTWSPTGRVIVQQNPTGTITSSNMQFQIYNSIGSSGLKEVMRITSDQNVGIGNSSPVYKLDVIGSVRLGASGDSSNPPQKTIIAGQSVQDPTGPFYGSYGFLELNATSNYTGGARRYAITNALDANKFAIIRSDSNMATMQMGVSGAVPAGSVADFVITNTGNVGIGTTSPGAKLQVEGVGTAGAATLKINTSSSSTFVHSQENLAANLTSGQHNILVVGKQADTKNSGYIGYYWAGDASNSNFVTIGHWGNDDIFRVYADNTVTMAGNVGIGTTSPSQRLHVSGRIKVDGGSADWTLPNPGKTALGAIHLDPNTTADNYGSAITWGSSDNNNGEYADAGIYVRTDGAYGSKMYFATTDSYSVGSKMRMTIDHGGNVGIGTTSPAYKLEVSGGAISIKGNAAGNSLRFDDSGGTSRNAMYLDTSNYLNVGNSSYAGIKLIHTATAPQANGLEGNQIAEGYGITENGKVLAEPNAWLAVRIGTTDYAIPMYTAG